MDQNSQSKEFEDSKSTDVEQSTTQEDLSKVKNLIEASLYVAGHPLEIRTLCSVTGISSRKRIQSLARTLVERYEKNQGAMQVVELEDGRFVMQLRHRYVQRVRRLSLKPLLTEGPLKTLSYVAYSQPIAQAKVILVRGAQAYDHVAHLLQMGLISREKFGKSMLLRTTELFSDYFSLSRDLRLMKKQLEGMFSQVTREKVAKIPSLQSP
ncbi:MAG: SMC-Scp complex subunit ScpB [Candidatus Bathyarchaeia archaeon]